ncbi:chorismate mutase [Kitasatospora sp. NPDC053057]|uniref:chorismate mutase n=1 Tax=Kitasatospora sp. NPDC053057 TaxID=3364062 RepID=UPI0037C5A539
MSLTVPSRVDERQDELSELDRSLIRMIRRRAELVGEIEALRRAAGLPRTELTRENRMLKEYQSGLGRPGVRLALLLLELARHRS